MTLTLQHTNACQQQLQQQLLQLLLVPCRCRRIFQFSNPINVGVKFQDNGRPNLDKTSTSLNASFIHKICVARVAHLWNLVLGMAFWIPTLLHLSIAWDGQAYCLNSIPENSWNWSEIDQDQWSSREPCVQQALTPSQSFLVNLEASREHCTSMKIQDGNMNWTKRWSSATILPTNFARETCTRWIT